LLTIAIGFREPSLPIYEVDDVLSELKKNSSPKPLPHRSISELLSENRLGTYNSANAHHRKKDWHNHALALQLWKTKIHEARHIATMIAGSLANI